MGVNHPNLLIGPVDLLSFPYPYITVLETPVQYENQKNGTSGIDKKPLKSVTFLQVVTLGAGQ